MSLFTSRASPDGPFDGLFTDPEVAGLWSHAAQVSRYLSIEAALSRALGAAGRVPGAQAEAAAQAIETAEIDPARLRSGTARDGLPIPDLVAQLRVAAGDAADAVHTGATSQDILDTALSMTLRDLARLLETRLDRVIAPLSALETAHGAAPLMGRTRMQAALPITVADRVAAWRRPLEAHLDALRNAGEDLARLQLGGAVVTLMDRTNVDTVMVAGQVRKWQGKLLGHDMAKLGRELAESRDYIFEKAGVQQDLFA